MFENFQHNVLCNFSLMMHAYDLSCIWIYPKLQNLHAASKILLESGYKFSQVHEKEVGRG